MSGYSRSCSRADSSILLVAQCAAALSMMPASAPSCWAQGVTAASYNEYAILGFRSRLCPLWQTNEPDRGGSRGCRFSPGKRTARAVSRYVCFVPLADIDAVMSLHGVGTGLRDLFTVNGATFCSPVT